MTTPAPDAGRDELHDQLLLNHILLDSLDPGADDYEQEKLRFEDVIGDIQQRLDGSPHTPTSQVDRLAAPRSGTSLSLPSRDTRINPNLLNASPSTNAPTWNGPGWDWPTASHSSPTSTSHHGRNLGPHTTKRHRDSVQCPTGDAFKKSRKNSETPTNSSMSTPASLDSLEQAERQVEAQNKSRPVQRDILARIREEAAQREAQFEKEKRDKEYARSLSVGRAPSFGQSSFPNSRSTQSYFRSNGKFMKPSSLVPPEPVQRPYFSQYDPSYSQRLSQHGIGGHVKLEPDTIRNGAYGTNAHRASTSSSHGYSTFNQPGSSSRVPISLDDDDDDVHVLGSSMSRTGVSPYHAAGPRDITSSRSLLSQSGGYLPSQTLCSQGHSYSDSRLTDYGQGYGNADGLASTSANPMTGATNVYGSTTNALYSGARALGSHVAGLLNSISGGFASNPIDLDQDYSATLQHPTLEQSLHARGWDGMINDPTHSREELESLIENIRPDEEIPPEMRIDTPRELKIVLMEHQKLGLAWLQKQEASNAKGGILADDMGLGKTIQALALIATRQSTDPGRKTTLIVAPVALLRQWKREIEQRMHPQHKLSVLIYHMQAKGITFCKLSTYDIVLTTYGKLASEYKKKTAFEFRRETDPRTQPRLNESLVLLDPRSKFHRVIVDEAQNIKNHNTKAALGALWLNATYRLCMTGTPMMNNVFELFSLIRFLRIPPYSDRDNFIKTFKRPLESTNESLKAIAMRHLQGLLKSIMLRRTKDSKIDGRPILNLPPRTTEVAHAIFDEDQEQLYRALETQVQLEMNKYLQKGKKLTNYSYVLVRLLRLRQACDHPHLIQDLSEEAYADVSPEIMEELAQKLSPEVVQRIRDANGAFECPICYDAVENPSIFFPCGHDCCPECFVRVTDPTTNAEGGHGAKCPECRQPLDTKKIIDYRSFKKVFMPEDAEADESAAVKEEVDADADSDDSSDEGDDDDGDDDVDSQGDLREFVVADNYIEEASDAEDEAERIGKRSASISRVGTEAPESGSAPFLSSILGEKKTKKAAKPKDKGKAKGKGKEKKTAKKFKKKLTLAELRAAGMRNKDAKKKYLRRLRKNYVTSAKIEKTLEIIRSTVANDPKEKVIIFSQFTSFLDLLELPMGDEAWEYRRYDGGMSANMRNNAAMDFQDTKLNVKIMLVSLKAGNAGLNLTAASQVIILDPFWNPFIEEQAVDRAHRIGQMKPVRVHRMLVENTVEDRIVELQEKKRELINTALDEKAGASLSRLGRSELRFLFGLDSRPES